MQRWVLSLTWRQTERNLGVCLLFCLPLSVPPTVSPIHPGSQYNKKGRCEGGAVSLVRRCHSLSSSLTKFLISRELFLGSKVCSFCPHFQMWGAVEPEPRFNPSAQAGQIRFPTQSGLCPAARRLPLGLQACEGLSEPHPQQEQPRTLCGAAGSASPGCTGRGSPGWRRQDRGSQHRGRGLEWGRLSPFPTPWTAPTNADASAPWGPGTPMPPSCHTGISSTIL